jgi:hypothetical protein
MRWLLLLFAATCLTQVVPPPSGGTSWGTGATLPATCGVGTAYFLTSASAGANWYLCTSTNVWTVQSGGTATGVPGSIVQFTIGTGGAGCPTSCETISPMTSGQGTHPTAIVYDNTGTQVAVGVTCTGGTYGCADNSSTGTIIIGPFANAGTYNALIIGGTGGFTNPMTLQCDFIIGGVGGAATRLAAGTLSYLPDCYPNGGTIGSGPYAGTYTTGADYAWFLAASAVVANIAGAEVAFGPNTYLKNSEWIFPVASAGPSPVNFPRYTVSLRGADAAYGTLTHVVQNTTISAPMLLANPTTGTYISPNVRDIDFDANNKATACGVFGGIVRAKHDNIDCRGMNGSGTNSAGWQLGNVASTSTPYELLVSHIKVETTDTIESGQTYAYGTVSGATLGTTTFTSNGSNFGISPGENIPTVYISGTASSGRACGTMPTSVVVTFSGGGTYTLPSQATTGALTGTVTNIVFSGASGCSGSAPIYFYVTEAPAIQFGFEGVVTDSTFDDVVSTVGQIAGIYSGGGANVWEHPHPYYTPAGFKDAGANTIIGGEFDRIKVFDVALGGPVFYSMLYTAPSFSNSGGTHLVEPIYVHASNLPGVSKYWLYNGGGGSSILGGICSGAVGLNFNEFDYSGGVINPGTTGYSNLPSNLDIRNNKPCNYPTVTPQDHIATGPLILGGQQMQGLLQPTSVVVTPQNAGTTTYTYGIQAYYQDGTHSYVGSGTSAVGSNSTISPSNTNVITWTGDVNTVYYGVEITAGPNAIGAITINVLPSTACTGAACTYTDTTATGSGVNFTNTPTAGQIFFSPDYALRYNGTLTGLTMYLATNNLPLQTWSSTVSEFLALGGNVGGSAPAMTITGTGCAATGGASGDNLGGQFTVTTAGASCGVQLTWGNSVTYPVGSICAPLQDRTSGLTGVQSASGTTSATFTSFAWVLNDVIQYGPCIGR